MLLFAVFIEGMKHTNTPEMWHGVLCLLFFSTLDLLVFYDESMIVCTCLVNTCSLYFTVITY